MMRKKTVIAILAALSPLALTASCSCPYVYELDSFQPNDKDKSCNEIVMEINEAEYYRKKAENNKGSQLGYYLNPFCYPSGFLSSDRSIRSAEERLDYLNQIYEMRGCGRQNRQSGAAAGAGVPGQRLQPLPPQPGAERYMAPQEYRHPMEGEERPDTNVAPVDPNADGIKKKEVK
ncbi:MAG: hypothetical protein K0R63_861 [Rickettsiales bacterium]|jgi:hypothetical protein|nr:hypothetical protein [Rickettsiales bacterium]